MLKRKFDWLFELNWLFIVLKWQFVCFKNTTWTMNIELFSQHIPFSMKTSNFYMRQFTSIEVNAHNSDRLILLLRLLSWQFLRFGLSPSIMPAHLRTDSSRCNKTKQNECMITYWKGMYMKQADVFPPSHNLPISTWYFREKKTQEN